MKKKITLVATSVLLVAAMVIGGTLAYFTDTDNAKNTFTVGNVAIELKEAGADGKEFVQNQVLRPGSNTKNNIVKSVTIENTGSEAAYCWIEVWVPSALDDGDDHSPTAPGLGNSLHFNYNSALVTETKATYLGSKEIDGVQHNGYVHFITGQVEATATAAGKVTTPLLDQVYMDKLVSQCTEEDHGDCIVLMDGKTHYSGDWQLVINAVGFQAEGVATVQEAITTYYNKDVTGHLWS